MKVIPALLVLLLTTRSFAQEIIGNGGYVSYMAGKVALYPEGYREDA